MSSKTEIVDRSAFYCKVFSTVLWGVSFSTATPDFAIHQRKWELRARLLPLKHKSACGRISVCHGLLLLDS